MINKDIPILLVLLHLGYYLYFQLFSDFVRKGMTTNKDNKIISELRTKYHTTIKTFQKNTDHYGFAGFRVIYLNENLFKRPRLLLYTFYHEMYHLKNNHKRNILLHRTLFSFVPLFLYLHWMVALVIYVSAAYSMEYIRKRYEDNANKFAHDMYYKHEVKVK
jgi:hypothetical protein